jgi:hypothetical protein
MLPQYANHELGEILRRQEASPGVFVLIRPAHEDVSATFAPWLRAPTHCQAPIGRHTETASINRLAIVHRNTPPIPIAYIALIDVEISGQSIKKLAPTHALHNSDINSMRAKFASMYIAMNALITVPAYARVDCCSQIVATLLFAVKYRYPHNIRSIIST